MMLASRAILVYSTPAPRLNLGAGSDSVAGESLTGDQLLSGRAGQAAEFSASLNQTKGFAGVTTKRPRFAILRQTRRVWAVGSIHGDAQRLKALHGRMEERFEPGDRVVYLGNMIGRGAAVGETLDELVTFRGRFLAAPRAFACDIAYLRGSQEEMWQKVMQLQFAADPRGVMAWMLGQGLGATLAAYGSSEEQGRRIAVAGTVDLTRWAGELRRRMQSRPGHYEIFGTLKRAAFTDFTARGEAPNGGPDGGPGGGPSGGFKGDSPDTRGGLLFVNAGLDSTRPLEAQNDSFWWGGDWFEQIAAPYERFSRVVRGYAAEPPGLKLADFTATVDGGCGRGGRLLAGCFRPDGALVDQIEA